MFEDSLIESAALIRRSSRGPALLSLTAQLAAAAALLALPLLHPEALPLARSLSATLAPPRPPAPPPPPIHLKPPQLASTVHSIAAPGSATTSAPIVRDLLHPSGPPLDAPQLAAIDLGARNSALPAGLNAAPPAGPRISVASVGSHPAAPPRISNGVSAGLLLAPIRPVYPAIARAAHTEGTVTIDALISRSGSIESARVVSGPPLLQQAALDAVLRARYRPYRLNGQPTEVQTTIVIHFRMAG